MKVPASRRQNLYFAPPKCLMFNYGPVEVLFNSNTRGKVPTLKDFTLKRRIIMKVYIRSIADEWKRLLQ